MDSCWIAVWTACVAAVTHRALEKFSALRTSETENSSGFNLVVLYESETRLVSHAVQKNLI